MMQADGYDDDQSMDPVPVPQQVISAVSVLQHFVCVCDDLEKDVEAIRHTNNVQPTNNAVRYK